MMESSWQTLVSPNERREGGESRRTLSQQCDEIEDSYKVETVQCSAVQCGGVCLGALELRLE